MRNLKKILALVLSLMMVLSVMVTASATDFVDDADITNKEAVEVMSALGILAGTDGKFNPQGTLYRDQAAKIIAFMKLGPDTDKLVEGVTTTAFSDVTGGWAMKYIAYCADLGIISGNDGKFFPGNTLTGYEFGKMVLNAAGIEGTYTGSNWKVNVAAALKANSLLAGLDKIVLSANITREQAAQMAWNAMKWGEKVDVTVTKYMIVGVSGATNVPDTVLGNQYDTFAAAQAAAKDAEPAAQLGVDYTINTLSYVATTTKDSLAEVNYNVASTITMEVTSIARDTNKASKTYGKLVATAGDYKWVVEDYSAIGTWVNVYYNKTTKAVYTATEQSVTVDVFGMSQTEWKTAFAPASYNNNESTYSFGTVKKYVNAAEDGTIAVTTPGSSASFLKANKLVFLYNATTGKYDLKSALVDSYTIEKVTVTKSPDGTIIARLADSTVVYNDKLTATGALTVDLDATDIDWAKYYNVDSTKSYGYFNAQKIDNMYYFSEVKTVTGTVAQKGVYDMYAVIGSDMYWVTDGTAANITNNTGITGDALDFVSFTLYLDVYGNYFATEKTEATSVASDVYYVTGTYDVVEAAAYGYTTNTYAQVVAMDGTISTILIGVNATSTYNAATGIDTLTGGLYTFATDVTAGSLSAKLGFKKATEFDKDLGDIDNITVFAGMDTTNTAIDLKATTGKIDRSDLNDDIGDVRLNSSTQYLIISAATASSSAEFAAMKASVITGGINATVPDNSYVIATKDADGNYVAKTVVITGSVTAVALDDVVYVDGGLAISALPYTDKDGHTQTAWAWTVYDAATGAERDVLATNSYMGSGFYTYTEVADGVITFGAALDAGDNAYMDQFYDSKYGTKITTADLADAETADTVIVDLRSAAAQKANPVTSAADMAYLKTLGCSVVFDAMIKEVNGAKYVVTLYVKEIIVDSNNAFAVDETAQGIGDAADNYVLVTIVSDEDTATGTVTVAAGEGSYALTWGDLLDLLPTGATILGKDATAAVTNGAFDVTAHDGSVRTYTVSGI